MLIHSPREFAILVKNQRKKLKLSQSDVASLVGLKQTTISAFENKPEGTKLDTIFQILAAVNLDIHLLAKDAMTQWQEEW